jgi:hypothetical protein
MEKASIYLYEGPLATHYYFEVELIFEEKYAVANSICARCIDRHCINPEVSVRRILIRKEGQTGIKKETLDTRLSNRICTEDSNSVLLLVESSIRNLTDLYAVGENRCQHSTFK